MRVVVFVCVIAALAAVSACGVPNLDPPECSESRTAVREFYSFHFGNEMGFSVANLEARKRFITPDLFETFKDSADGSDPFTTGTSDIPKAFRVAECKVLSEGNVGFEVLLFWRDDTRSEQRTIRVEAQKIDGQWLISRISQN